MGAIVSFNVSAWKARYPEFASVEALTAQAYFDEATIYHDNSGAGPVSTATVQSSLLNMLTAHIAALNSSVTGQGQAQLVGRISNATEGSVSVQADYIDPSTDLQAWLQQTKYGAAYYAATARFRTMHYRVPLPRITDPWGRRSF